MSYGYNRDDAYWAEMRRKANENLKKIGDGVYRREADAKRKVKGNELSRADPAEIQSGFIVLEARRIRKELHSLLIRDDLEGPELEYAEELQSQMDDYDAVLEPHSERELRRFVRLWNKSQKQRYKLP